jgi:hypothetical protein
MRFKLVLACLLAATVSQTTFAQRPLVKNVAPPIIADVSAAEVRESIKDGVRFLLKRQKNTGKWQDMRSFPDGVTGLVTLSLLNAGVRSETREMQAALTALQRREPENLSTYAISLRIMAMALADPEGRRYLGRIRDDVAFLVRSQKTEGANAGGWGYGGSQTGLNSADASNSQFAILALHEASILGVKIDDNVWLRAKGYWSRLHQNGKGFVYSAMGGDTRVTGSMTCAGISSWLVINENLAEPNDFLTGGRVACCGLDADLKVVQDSFKWMADHFTVKFNPAKFRSNSGAKYYYLYGMERAGRLAGERFFGAYDWYRHGAAHLVEEQNRDGSWRGSDHSENMVDISTAFSLLFLAKGRRPVVFGKYQHSVTNDWDRHPKGIHYLTRQIENDWNLKLNWQTVRGIDADVDDLLEAPVLYISGRDELRLTAKQEDNLKKYIENGGFIFAEACQGDGCGDNVAFDRSFRNLIGRLFPDSALEALPADHPIWSANYRIQKPDPNWPVLGVQACCRTSIVYVPRNLTGFWRLNRKNLIDVMPRRVADEISYTTKIGVNVAAYATGRELDDKGERPKIAAVKNFEMLAGRNLHFPKLNHAGGADDAPNAWRNLLNEIKYREPSTGDQGNPTGVALRLKMEKKMISPIKEQLAEHPFVFMHGRNDFSFTREEQEAIKRYLELGGFIFADSICSSPEFTTAFRREFSKIFRDQKLKAIADSHPLFNDGRYGWPLHEGVLLNTPDPDAQNGYRQRTIPPVLESLEVNGRLAVVFSPYDISCAMENATATQCEGYQRESAVKIGTNVILYRLRSD